MSVSFTPQSFCLDPLGTRFFIAIGQNKLSALRSTGAPLALIFYNSIFDILGKTQLVGAGS
jgi:hypothetical protein